VGNLPFGVELGRNNLAVVFLQALNIFVVAYAGLHGKSCAYWG